jgi:hypothetical protein
VSVVEHVTEVRPILVSVVEYVTGVRPLLVSVVEHVTGVRPLLVLVGTFSACANDNDVQSDPKMKATASVVLLLK